VVIVLRHMVRKVTNAYININEGIPVKKCWIVISAGLLTQKSSRTPFTPLIDFLVLSDLSIFVYLTIYLN
jgi:hypothetical protein